ncbi:hypothetical protein SAICODRAFT_89218 [Saitoella complicata NRRL Y-17804]|uniref:uncharacterized protein n=1 Tax=Saitoella complicata (strain BCRC 22490 / CBS 7301 / JCM 7358 / NBRC 10748 / NRRL Y-17804) TaxID=698492 RepID=UPI000867EF0F|nr:uncharacterized protein SAICODRAFT_89218 [Saitoella complicata NRRL Y-17804]ODQ55066.1 hypothetical protein SAICODRAFT_89218 [Saitoella complicata NRRL Y-17804]
MKKALASTGQTTLSIALAEPVLFLTGYEPNEFANTAPAMLRGSLILKIQKACKVKAITLIFKGRARTEWPEGIPPRKTEFYEEKEIMTHAWPFFNAQFPMAEHTHGADAFKPFGGPIQSSPLTTSTLPSLGKTNSRSFTKHEHTTTQMRGYRIFPPGEYAYTFELPLDSKLPETIECDMGSVKYELEAIVERAGAFKSDLKGKTEIVLIRSPGEGSLEGSEPIAISRNWYDQLHYDIVVSGKAFPIGQKIPIAFKLTPLAKVRVHRIKIFLTENVEYYCRNKKVHRLEPTRKILLLEKSADNASASSSSNPVQDGSDSLLGQLEGNLSIGSTELEFSAQIPGCTPKEKKEKLHFDTTYPNIRVHHWLKIVMRLSKVDENNSGRRRHFEISIDSPIHLMSCRCTMANTALPAYEVGPKTVTARLPCPCQTNQLNGNNPSSAGTGEVIPMVDPMAELMRGGSGEFAPESANSIPSHMSSGRPMHLLRAPSMQPPSFFADVAPPPMMTPPPTYESVVPEEDRGGEGGYFVAMHTSTPDDDQRVGRSEEEFLSPVTSARNSTEDLGRRRRGSEPPTPSAGFRHLQLGENERGQWERALFSRPSTGVKGVSGSGEEMSSGTGSGDGSGADSSGRPSMSLKMPQNVGVGGH